MQVLGVIDGYPCVSLSSQNTQPKSINDAESASGSGLKSLFDFLDAHPEVQWIITAACVKFIDVSSILKGN